MPRFSQGCSGGERGVATRSYLPLQFTYHYNGGREGKWERKGLEGVERNGEGREGKGTLKQKFTTTPLTLVQYRFVHEAYDYEAYVYGC